MWSSPPSLHPHKLGLPLPSRSLFRQHTTPLETVRSEAGGLAVLLSILAPACHRNSSAPWKTVGCLNENAVSRFTVVAGFHPSMVGYPWRPWRLGGAWLAPGQGELALDMFRSWCRSSRAERGKQPGGQIHGCICIPASSPLWRSGQAQARLGLV
jgi:hypothetical protein